MAASVGVFQSRVRNIGFQELGGLPGLRGNPQVRNLFEIIVRLQEREGLHLKVRAVR